VVRVNTQCALACRYCAYSRELPRLDRCIENETLRPLGESLQEHILACNQEVMVCWLGGEPFQWRSWREQTERMVHGYGVPVGITTNGLALGNPRVRRRALELFREITVSIDGLSSFHNEVRKFPGLYQRLHAIVRQLLEERQGMFPRLRVNCVLTRNNVEDFGVFCRAMDEVGFEELTFNALGGNDRPDYFRDNRLLPEHIHRLETLLPGIRAECSGMVVRGSAGYLRRLLATSQGEIIPVQNCDPGERFLFIDEFGRLGPCNFVVSRLGVQVEDWAGLGISAWRHQLRVALDKCQPDSCRDCHATHVFEKFC
jgi:sulfatase maturation enzyme AslB (radical SAM superfamily)